MTRFALILVAGLFWSNASSGQEQLILDGVVV